MNDENTFKILLATDNHLGFLEKDQIRGNDSFITFEEILSIGGNLKPDFVLLGGDLFHENKPTLSSLFKCTELLRKYSFNEREIKFKIVSDQNTNFSHSNFFKHANFNDDNVNVGMPVFSIHGNHDDPIDKSNLCALDLLHASGLLNLFGKNDSVELVEIHPILLCKGTTKIALYGLGAIRNERLNRLWTQNKVVFRRPTQDAESWFSVFVVHQNRVKHGPSNYLPENLLPSFLDLVIWGHEHDCRIDPEWVPSSELYISQPGSSVATSLSDGEAIDKYIGLLKVQGREFVIEKHRLKTVRPFVTESIVLQDEEHLDVTDSHIVQQLDTLCCERLDCMLIEADGKRTMHEQQPLLPLLRLKVDYSGGFELFSTARLSQRYVDRVANTGDMIVLHRKKEYSAREKVTNENVFIKDVGPDATTVEEIVRHYFLRAGDKLRMLLLNERELGVGVKLFVDKDNNEMVAKVVEIQIDRVLEAVKKRQSTEVSLDREIAKIVDLMKTMCSREEGAEEDDDFEESLRRRLLKEVTGGSVVDVCVISDEDSGDQDMPQVVKTRGTRGRGRGRGRGESSQIKSEEMSFETSSVGGKRKEKTDSVTKKECVKRKKY